MLAGADANLTADQAPAAPALILTEICAWDRGWCLRNACLHPLCMKHPSKFH